MEQVADHLSDCQELGVRCYEPHPALNVAIAFCVRCYEPHKKKNMIVWMLVTKKVLRRGRVTARSQ